MCVNVNAGVSVRGIRANSTKNLSHRRRRLLLLHRVGYYTGSSLRMLDGGRMERCRVRRVVVGGDHCRRVGWVSEVVGAAWTDAVVPPTTGRRAGRLGTDRLDHTHSPASTFPVRHSHRPDQASESARAE